MVIETIGTEKGKKARQNQASCCDDTVEEKSVSNTNAAPGHNISL
jgi:hypothetical protein